MKNILQTIIWASGNFLILTGRLQGLIVSYEKAKPAIMARYGEKAGEKVEEALHEMHEGKLKSGRSGKKVTSRKQAVAIGLSEAREEGGKVPKKAASKKGGAKKKSALKKSTAKKSATGEGTAKKSASKKSAAKKAAPKKAAAKKTATKKSTASKRTAGKSE